jgi:hypothetical protein
VEQLTLEKDMPAMCLNNSLYRENGLHPALQVGVLKKN